MASSSTLFRLFFISITIITSVSADLFVVGGAFGWKVPNDTQFYYVWAVRRQFYVGDTLRFHYNPVDTLMIIPEWAFARCDNRRPAAVFKGGDTQINLDKAGLMCFISGDPSQCIEGLRMGLEVHNPDPEDTNSSVAPPPSIPNVTVPPSIPNVTVPSSRLISLAPSLPNSTVWFAVYKLLTALIVFVINL